VLGFEILTEPELMLGLVGSVVEDCPCATPCVITVNIGNASKHKTASLILGEMIRDFSE